MWLQYAMRRYHFQDTCNITAEILSFLEKRGFFFQNLAMTVDFNAQFIFGHASVKFISDYTLEIED